MNEFTITAKPRFNIDDTVYPVYRETTNDGFGGTCTSRAAIRPQVIRGIRIIIDISSGVGVEDTIFYCFYGDWGREPVAEKFIFTTKEEAEEKSRGMNG